MKSRQEIKAIAKNAMKAQRSTSILTVLIVSLIIAAGSIFNYVPGGVFGAWMVLATVFFIDFVLTVHSAGIFTKVFNGENTSANELFSNFKVNYLRKVGGMAWMTLFIYLWMMLLIVPGIIKAISYSMTPYILANNPNVTARQALKLSMRMTNGHKMDLFVMGLSFIGWLILSALTCGILYVAYVGPYMETTYAGYYVELRDKAIASGAIQESELTGRMQ